MAVGIAIQALFRVIGVVCFHHPGAVAGQGLGERVSDKEMGRGYRGHLKLVLDQA